MAWTTPRTYLVGEAVTAAILNIHVRDNLNFLYAAPGCRAYRTTNQSINNAEVTALSLTSEEFDTDAMHDNATNPSRLTFNTPGLWLVVGNLRWAANATGGREAQVRHSVAATIAETSWPEVGSGDDAALNCGTYWPCVAGEYVELYGYQTSGGALNATPQTIDSPSLCAHWLSGES